MKWKDNDIFPYYTFENLSAFSGLLHFVSSGGNVESLSVGYGAEVPDPFVTRNRMRLASAVGFRPEQLTVGEQVHSSRITVVTENDRGCGALENGSRLPATDALITDCKDICLMTLTADCVPVLLYDPCCEVIAAVHAGWKGTVGGIVAATVERMKTVFGCDPRNMITGIGPSIGKCCFEVGREVAEEFRKIGEGDNRVVLAGKTADKKNIDLWEVNRRQLLKAGLDAEHIEMAGICTSCGHDRFFSYRFEKGNTGRLGSGLMMSSETGKR